MKDKNTSKVFGNILSLSVSELAARLIALLGIGFVARKLGPEGFGIIGFATALFGYLGIVVTAGFNDIGTREITRRPHQLGEIAANIILVRIILAFSIFFLTAAGIYLLDYEQTVKLVILLMSLSLFTTALDVSWIYRGLERSRRTGIATLLGQAVNLLILLQLVQSTGDIYFVPLAQFAGEFCTIFLLLIPFYRFRKSKINAREGLKIFKESSYWTISRLMRLLNGTFDIVLLGIIIGERAVGLYSAPYRICFALLVISVAIHSAYLPAVTRAMSDGVRMAEFVVERSINLAASISAPIIVGGMILAPQILQTVFGAEFVEGSQAFQFLLLSVGLVFLHGAQHNIFLTSGLTKKEMIVFTIGAGINVGLNLYVIPHYGITGAAVVTAIAEGLTLLIGLIVISRAGIRLNYIRAVWRAFAASALMGSVLLIFGSKFNLFISIAAGAGLYTVFLFVMRGFPPDARLYLKNLAALAINFRAKFLAI